MPIQFRVPDMTNVKTEAAKAQDSEFTAGDDFIEKLPNGDSFFRIAPPWSEQGIIALYVVKNFMPKSLIEPGDTKKAWFIDPEETYPHAAIPNPIMEAYRELEEEGAGDALKQYKPSGTYYCNAWKRDPNHMDDVVREKPYILNIRPSVYNQIMTYMVEPTYGNITHPLEGYDLKITRTGEGLQTRYTTMVLPSVVTRGPGPVVADEVRLTRMLEGMSDLNKVFPIPNAEKLAVMTQYAKAMKDHVHRLGVGNVVQGYVPPDQQPAMPTASSPQAGYAPPQPAGYVPPQQAPAYVPPQAPAYVPPQQVASVPPPPAPVAPVAPVAVAPAPPVQVPATVPVSSPVLAPPAAVPAPVVSPAPAAVPNDLHTTEQMMAFFSLSAEHIVEVKDYSIEVTALFEGDSEPITYYLSRFNLGWKTTSKAGLTRHVNSQLKKSTTTPAVTAAPSAPVTEPQLPGQTAAVATAPTPVPTPQVPNAQSVPQNRPDCFFNEARPTETGWNVVYAINAQQCTLCPVEIPCKALSMRATPPQAT